MAMASSNWGNPVVDGKPVKKGISSDGKYCLVTIAEITLTERREMNCEEKVV